MEVPSNAAQAIVSAIGSPDPSAPGAEAPVEMSAEDVAVDEMWAAIQGGDKEAFREGLRSFVQVAGAPREE